MDSALRIIGAKAINVTAPQTWGGLQKIDRSTMFGAIAIISHRWRMLARMAAGLLI